MKISDLVPRLKPQERLYISIDTWVDDNGQRKWSGPLSEAQMYAYWNHTIGPMHEEAGKIYCIIYYTKSGGVNHGEQQTYTESAGS